MSGVYNIIFLDIDSVLNHSGYGESIYDNDPVENNVPLCKDNISALKYIVENVNSPKIVWSTDWRIYDKDTWNDWMNPRIYMEQLDWFGKLVIGKTPKKMSSEHFEEIHFWLHWNEYYRNHRFEESELHWPVNNFVILDDLEYGMDRYGDHYFHCDPETGLTTNTAHKIVEFLKTADYNAEEWYNENRD